VCCKIFMGDSAGSSEYQHASGNKETKDSAHEVSDGKNSLLGIGLEATNVTFWQISFLYFV
jgi:hypothetical protein